MATSIICYIIFNHDEVCSMDYDTPLFRVTHDILSDDTSVNILTMMKVYWLHDKCNVERKDSGKSEVSRYIMHEQEYDINITYSNTHIAP